MSVHARKPPPLTAEELAALSPFPGAVSEAEDSKTWRRAIVAAVVFHILLLLVSLPQLQSNALPEVDDEKTVFVVQRPPQFKKPKPPTTEVKPLQERRRLVPVPDETPDDPERVPELAPPEIEVADIDLVLDIPAPPPVPEATGPIRVGGKIERPERLHEVQPRYTELARRARIEGTVILEAVIDRQGRVGQIKVLKGLPMGLTEEAVKAVEQWRYQVSTLNGKPVEVLFALSVHFRLP